MLQAWADMLDGWTRYDDAQSTQPVGTAQKSHMAAGEKGVPKKQSRKKPIELASASASYDL